MIERAVTEQGILPGTLTLGTDNGSAFTARATRLVMSGLGIAHHRDGYRADAQGALQTDLSTTAGSAPPLPHPSETKQANS